MGKPPNPTPGEKGITEKTPKLENKLPRGWKMLAIASTLGSMRCKGTPSTGGLKKPHQYQQGTIVYEKSADIR